MRDRSLSQDEPPIITSINLWSEFRRSLVVNADRAALQCGPTTWTYADLALAVASAYGSLSEAGVGAGDRVVLFLENEFAFPVADLALMALGAVKVPVSAALTGAEVDELAERVRATAIVAGSELAKQVNHSGGATVITSKALLAHLAPPLPERAPARWEDPAVVYFTGGTTGKPKGIVHSQGGTVTNLWAHMLEGSIGHEEVMLLTTPMAHAAGLFTLAGLLRGAMVKIERRFDPVATLECISRDAVTWTFVVPTMIYRLLDLPQIQTADLSALRTIQYGAAPISPARLRESIERFGPVLQQLYAQTECPNYATLLRKSDHVAALEEPSLLASCGRSTVMCDVSVRDETGLEVESGESGEVCLRAPYLMDGYWDDEEEARKRFTDGWLRTGDIGYLDDRGYLFLVDRRNDMIITGGLNVYSAEVERIICEFPGVRAAAVVGLPHDDWGEAVHGVVVVGDGFTNIHELKAFCRQRLAAYKTPKHFEVVDELPLTQYGKVDKKMLRNRAPASTEVS